MKFYVVTLVIGSLFFFSCTKDTRLSEVEQINNPIQLEYIDLDVEMNNGILKFENLDLFLDALVLVSSSEKGYVSDEVVEDWTIEKGFNSLRFRSDSLLKSTFYSENNLELPNVTIQTLLNEDGIVQIGDDFHFFSDNYQIVAFNNVELVKTVVNQDSQQTKNGIRYPSRSKVELRACNLPIVQRTIFSNGTTNNNSVELGVKSSIRTLFSPRRDVYGQVIGHEIALTVNTYTYHKQKKWWGWKKLKDVDLRAHTGWTAYYVVEGGSSGTMHAGYNWTINTWEIDYTWPLLTNTYIEGSDLPNVNAFFTSVGHAGESYELSPSFLNYKACN